MAISPNRFAEVIPQFVQFAKRANQKWRHRNLMKVPFHFRSFSWPLYEIGLSWRHEKKFKYFVNQKSYLTMRSIIKKIRIIELQFCLNSVLSNFPVDHLLVRAGEWDTQKTIEPLEHQDRSAKHVSIHPLFNPKNLVSKLQQPNFTKQSI